MKTIRPQRASFFENAYLGTEDFKKAQEYIERLWQEHNRLQHTAGVIEGLDLTVVPNNGGFRVGTGYALTDDGRIAYLENRKTIDPRIFDLNNSDNLYVYLVSKESKQNQRQANAGACESPLNQQSPSITEQTEINVMHTAPSQIPMNKRICLGRISRDVSLPNSIYQVDLLRRHNAGLIAAQIRSISRDTAAKNGSALDQAAEIHLGPTSNNPEAVFAVVSPQNREEVEKLIRPLEVSRDKTRIHATDISGELLLKNGVLRFSDTHPSCSKNALPDHGNDYTISLTSPPFSKNTDRPKGSPQFQEHRQIQRSLPMPNSRNL